MPGWTPGPVWMGVDNLCLTGIRSPDRPGRSESLQRLSYSCPERHINKENIFSLFDVFLFLSIQLDRLFEILLLHEIFYNGLGARTCAYVSYRKIITCARRTLHVRKPRFATPVVHNKTGCHSLAGGSLDTAVAT